MRVLIVAPHVRGFAPGQRVRVESWAEDLAEAGVDTTFSFFESQGLNKILHSPGRVGTKAVRLATDWVRQGGRTLRHIRSMDGVILHREAALIGPDLIERIPALLDVPVLYDIDDPVFQSYQSPNHGWATKLKFHGKTDAIIRRSARVTAINERIASHAREFNKNVDVIPNFIDVKRYKPRTHRHLVSPLRVLWIGSQSTMTNLDRIAPILQTVNRSHPVQLVMVGPADAAAPDVDNVEMHAWSPSTEVEVASTCDVGIVPVPDAPWADWKFYFKVLQYMSAGLPVVADDRGSNRDVLEQSGSGYAVANESEWGDRLIELHESTEQRSEMGGRGRSSVEERYDVRHQAQSVYRSVEATFGAF